MSTVESDEAYARRLQVQELGGYVEQVNAQTPLMRDRQGNMTANPTVINARMNEIASSWATVAIITIANIPQIIAGIIVLYLYWDIDRTCDSEHNYRNYLQEHPERYQKLVSLRNTIEAFALIWFVVGNMWLFGEDDDSCTHPHNSHIYNLCFSYLIIMYLQGATQSVLDSIPVITITEEHSNVTCPICLNELVVGESARSLSCAHIFHQQCVDEWLRVNATCPTCRKPLVDPPQQASTPPSPAATPAAPAHTHSTPSPAVGEVSVGGVQLMPIATQTPASGQERRSDSFYNYEML
eukprot:gene37631-45715_t